MPGGRCRARGRLKDQSCLLPDVAAAASNVVSQRKLSWRLPHAKSDDFSPLSHAIVGEKDKLFPFHFLANDRRGRRQRRRQPKNSGEKNKSLSPFIFGACCVRALYCAPLSATDNEAHHVGTRFRVKTKEITTTITIGLGGQVPTSVRRCRRRNQPKCEQYNKHQHTLD